MGTSRAMRQGGRARVSTVETTKTDAGNGSAPNSPARRALAYRDAFLGAVTPDDVAAIGAALLERAKAGDLTAARLVLDRVLGSEAVGQWKDTGQVEAEEKQRTLYQSFGVL